MVFRLLMARHNSGHPRCAAILLLASSQISAELQLKTGRIAGAGGDKTLQMGGMRRFDGQSGTGVPQSTTLRVYTAHPKCRQVLNYQCQILNGKFSISGRQSHLRSRQEITFTI
jgi:hypothetical protein